MQRSVRLLSLAVLALPLLSLPRPLSAQRDDDDWMNSCERSYGRRRSEPFCEVRVSGYKAKPGVMKVDAGENGGVEVVGWDKDSVEIHARIQAYDRNADDAQDIAHRITIKVSGNDIGYEGPDLPRGSQATVSFLVLVPRHSDLTLDTENGPLAVASVNGTISLTSVNGPVDITRVSGDVRVRSQNGPVNVRLDGVRWTGTGLDASSENGPVNLGVPRDYNANLEFGTVNGPMSVGFPVTTTLNGRMSRRISTQLGSGGAPLRVVTTNGPFTLERTSTLER